MCDVICCFVNGFLNLITNQTFWTAVGAIGTFFVAYLALFPRKEKEIIRCTYWELGRVLRVSIDNKSDVNCVLDKGSYLIINMADSGELKSEPLEMQEFIPAHSRCNVHYKLSEAAYNVICADIRVSIFLFTQRGTVVKLQKGLTGEPMPITLVDSEQSSQQFKNKESEE